MRFVEGSESKITEGRYFSSEENAIFTVQQEHSESRRKERVDPPYNITRIDTSKGHKVSPLERYLTRRTSQQRAFTTAQLRTNINMFGLVAHAPLSDLLLSW